MEFSSTEPRLSSYLHARACRSGTPLAGNFELTARCNFNCKMCYVHLTAEEQQRRGRELTADEWLAIAQEARSRGMLFLLLTGGEPLIRKDFRYLLTELKKMGLLVSVNSNGSLIDRDWLDFFRHEPPFRFNITQMLRKNLESSCFYFRVGDHCKTSLMNPIGSVTMIS